MANKRHGRKAASQRGYGLQFSNERLLQEALVGLLQRMRNTFDVQLVHGALETGKDIVFKTSAPFEQILQCACVVKNVPISGDVKSKSSAQAALIQARQALANEYIDAGGERRRIHRVFVISSCTISVQAMNSIAGELREKAGQVQFIGGEELARQFLKLWPDFFADEAAAMQIYMRELENSLVEQSELSRIARMYPNAGLASNRVLNYVPTGVRHRSWPEDINNYIHSIDSGEFGPHAVSLVALSRVQRKLLERRSFLEHVGRYFPVTPLQVTAEAQIDSFIEMLHDNWLQGPIRRMPASEKGDVNAEYRIATNFSVLAENLRRLTQATHVQCSDIAAALRRGFAFVKVARAETPLLFNKTFLRYVNAMECLQSYNQSATSSNSSLSRDIVFGQEEFLQTKGLKIVVGPVGYGKTSLCRWRALNDIKHLRGSESKRVPFYIRLAYVNPNHLKTASQLLSKGAQSALLSDHDWRNVKRGTADVQVYLDGLDEVATDSDRKAVVDAARLLAKRHPGWCLIITSRNYVHGPWLKDLPRLELMGFSDDNIHALADKMLSDSTHSSAAFRQQLDTLPELRALMHVPLLATLTILVFKGTGQLPASRSTIYLTFVDLLCGGWDLAKNFQRSIAFGREIKIAVLARLATTAHQGKARTFGTVEFGSACLAAAPGVFAAQSMEQRAELADSLLQEFVQDGLLSRSGDQVYFTHFSFQEFMAGRQLAAVPAGGTLHEAYEDYIGGDDWWREVLRFVIGLSPDPATMVEWLLLAYGALESRTLISEKRQELLIDEVSRSFPNFRASWR